MRQIAIGRSGNKATLILAGVHTSVLISIQELEHSTKLFGLIGKKSIIDAAVMELHNAYQLTDEERAFYKEILKDMI